MVDLSVVIPVFNEGRKIQADIKAVAAFFQKERLNGEIIVVDDGSKDNTAVLAKEVSVVPPVKVIHYEKNQGKGHAVREGMKEARGRYAMFADSGCCIPYHYALRGMDLIASGQCDIAHASRKLPDSILKRPPLFSRRITSQMFRLFVIAFMNVPAYFSDTQCGFKIYKGDVARELYADNHSSGLTFDVEVILRAREKGYKICEFPVEWSCDYDTRVFPLLAFRHVFAEFVTMKKMMQNSQSRLTHVE